MTQEEIRLEAKKIAQKCIEYACGRIVGNPDFVTEQFVEFADMILQSQWHKASEDLPKDRVFLAHCIGMGREFIDRILWNERNGGFDNLNDTLPSASIKESHFEDYYDYWMEIPELLKEEKK